MRTGRYFWGTFRSVADKNFVAFRSFTFGETEYAPGDSFDKSAATRRQLETLFSSKKIKPVGAAVDSPSDDQEGTVERDEGEVSYPPTGQTPAGEFGDENGNSAQRTAKIVEGKAGWFYVEDEAGEKIGKATRDEAEAAEIKAAYERGEEVSD